MGARGALWLFGIWALAAEQPEVRFDDHDCMRIKREEQAIDWSGFHDTLGAYLERREGKDLVEVQETQLGGALLHFVPEVAALRTVVVELDGLPRRQRAQKQCPLGMLSLCIIEATALASMHTEELEAKFQCIKELLAAVPVFALAGSKWPVFRLLDQLWSLNKMSLRDLTGYTNINRFVQRQYADLVLTPKELAPFGIGHSVPWDSWLRLEEAGSNFLVPRLQELVEASRASYNGLGPSVRALASAVMESVDRDGSLADHGRPVVRISLAFGTQWARLLPVSWARWAAMGFRAAVVAAMDDAALEVCLQFHLNCVPTGVPSVLHKYSLTVLALHLGVDVLYCDLDAVPVAASPLHAVRAALGTPAADIAVSTHNYDCLNAGVWFARSTNTTALFFILLLEYLYEHWYEGDQRAFNAFSTGNVSVSYEAALRARLPQLRVAVLSPDTFAGPEGFTDALAVQLFHAYRIYGDEKFRLVAALYGLPALPTASASSRAKLWAWATDAEMQRRVRLSGLGALAAYAGPRTSTSCW